MPKQSLYSKLQVVDVHQDVARSIVSLEPHQDVFNDLTDDLVGRMLAHTIASASKPPLRRLSDPVIDSPFDDAAWCNAIAWPFKNWQTSRFSDGTYGVWYGADTVETTVAESAYHWYRGLLSDAGFEQHAVIGERQVYLVSCDAILLDFRKVSVKFPELLHSVDYAAPHAVGARIHHEGHPGLLIQSVRSPKGSNFALFNPTVLSNPRMHFPLTYRLEYGRIVVEKHSGEAWMSLDTANMQA